MVRIQKAVSYFIIFARVVSLALVAMFVYYTFVDTDWQERYRMQAAINAAVLQAVQEAEQ